MAIRAATPIIPTTRALLVFPKLYVLPSPVPRGGRLVSPYSE